MMEGHEDAGAAGTAPAPEGEPAGSPDAGPPAGEATADTLAPITEPPKVRTRRKRGPKPKPDSQVSPRTLRARKQRQNTRARAIDSQLQLVADATKTAEAASEGPAAAAPAAGSAAAIATDAAGEAAAVLVSDDALRQIIGGTFDGIARKLPPKWGGGALSEDEKSLLGLSWVDVVKPYLGGPAGPWTVAIAATVQCFAVRAMAQSAAADATTPGHRAAPVAPAPAAAAAPAKSPPAKSAARDGKGARTVAGVGGAQFDSPDA